MADNVVEGNERLTLTVASGVGGRVGEELDPIVAGRHVEIEVDGNGSA